MNGKRYYVHDIVDIEAGTGRNSGLVGTTPPKGGANITSSEPSEYPSIRNIVKKHLGVKPLDENNYKWSPFREVFKEIQELYGLGGDAKYEARLARDLQGMEKETAQREKASQAHDKEHKEKTSLKQSLGKIKEYFFNRENNLSYIERHLRKMDIKVTDEESAYWAASDHAYNKARVLAYAIDIDKQVGKALGGWAGKGWGSVTMPDGTTKTLTADKAFGEYLALNRQATERAEIFNKYGKKEALEELDYLRRKVGEDNWKRILEAKRTLNEIRRAQIFPFIKESGAFSEAVINKMENNEDYATFRVVFENDDPNTMPALKPVGIHAQKGNLLDIGNAFTATVSNDMHLLDFVSRNNYRLKAFNILELGAANGMKFNVKKAEPDRYGHIKDAGSGNKMETVYALENGKTVACHMDKELAAMIRTQNPTTHAFWGALKWFGSWWKPLVTSLNPYFQAPNLIRDNAGTAFNNKGLAGVRYVKNWFASLPEAWRFHDKEVMSDTYREMLQKGALNTGYTYSARGDMGVEEIERRVLSAFTSGDRAAERRILGKIWDGMSAPFRWGFHIAETVSGTVEYATKLAGYKTSLQKGLDKTPLAAARRTRKDVGTPDALAGGTLTKYMNQLVPFSNMVIQGNLAALRAIQKHPVRSIGLMATFGGLSNVPAILSKYNLFAPLLTSWFGMDEEDAESWIKK